MQPWKPTSPADGLADSNRADLGVMALDFIADGVVVVDEAGVILYANQLTTDLFGFQIDELVGQPIEMLVPAPYRDEHRRDREAFVGRRIERPMGRPDLDIEGLRADGTRFPIDVRLTPLPGSRAVAATIRDMTRERHVVVDRAMDRIDLMIARERIDRLATSHDHLLQNLFALAAHLRAQGLRKSPDSDEALFEASLAISDLIEVLRRELLDDSPSESKDGTAMPTTSASEVLD